MNVIQIQDLINKIGEFNQSNVLKEYSDGGEELLESQLKIIQDTNDELNHKILIQLKEKCDVELLQKFINLINTNGENLINLYHQYRRKLAESNNSNPIYIESIPIICKLIDAKLDVLTNLKSDLILKIANFDYRINTDFDYNSNTLSASNLNHKKEYAGKATFNLSKIETIMLFYILEKGNLLKFENDEFRPKFMEENFCYTVNQSETHRGESAPIKGAGTDFSNLKNYLHIARNNRTLEKLQDKIEKAILEFKFK